MNFLLKNWMIRQKPALFQYYFTVKVLLMSPLINMRMKLYRLDGTNFIAVVDGKIFAFVSRSKTVDLIKAVNELARDS